MSELDGLEKETRAGDAILPWRPLAVPPRNVELRGSSRLDLDDDKSAQAGLETGWRSSSSGSLRNSTDGNVGKMLDPDIEANSVALPSDSQTKEGQQNSNIVSWDGPRDPENPMNFPFRLRWAIISLVSAVCFVLGLSSAMFAPAVPALMKEFHSTNEALGSLVVTIFVLGLAAGPLVFAPLSELYGRLILQHVGNVGFLAFTIACALATNLNMLIGFRLIQGTFAAIPLTNGGAVIADMIKQEERGFALAMFTLGVLFGPVVGPVAGGFLAAAKDWRWVFWVLAILQGVFTLLCFIVWRESYPPILLERKATRLRKETGNSDLRSRYDNGLMPRAHFKRGIIRVVKMLVFSPVVLCLSIYNGLVYAYFYLLMTTLTTTFESIYHFGPSIVGLSYLGVGGGFMVGQIVFGKLSDRTVQRLADKHNSEMKPEYRLPLCVAGGFLIPVAFFCYGWSAQAKAQWIVPIIGTGFLGWGNTLIFMSIQAYSIDAYTIFAASALAANTTVRSVMAAVLPLAAPKMYAALGVGWGNSLLAFLALAMVPMPWLFFKYGERLRGLNASQMSTL